MKAAVRITIEIIEIFPRCRLANESRSESSDIDPYSEEQFFLAADTKLARDESLLETIAPRKAVGSVSCPNIVMLLFKPGRSARVVRARDSKHEPVAGTGFV